MTNKYHVLLIENERNARDYLKHLLLTRYNDIKVVGEAETVQQALLLFETISTINGAFVDVNLDTDGPQAGLDLAFNLNQRNNPPWIIFTTAYDYAVTAINDIHPVAYLLKPIDLHKLDAALDYMRRTYTTKPIIIHPSHTESQIEIRHIVVNKLGDKEKCRSFIKPSHIVYFKKNSCSPSLRIRCKSGILLDGVCGTLTEWRKKLNAPYFMQIHKSHFVNLMEVQSIHAHPLTKETYQLSFKCCPDRLTIGGGFYEHVVEKLSFSCNLYLCRTTEYGGIAKSVVSGV